MAKDTSDTGAGKPAKKPGRIAQLRTVLEQSRQLDPKIGWWMLLAFVGTWAVIIAIGWAVNWPVYAAILGFPLALLAAAFTMSRRAERAAYARMSGQPGAAGAALTSLRGGWFTDQQPVAVEAGRGGVVDAAMVYRAVGRPGIVLVAEGPTAKAQRLLALERKKTARVAPDVPITTFVISDEEGEGLVPIRKLSSRVQRMRPILAKGDVAVVQKRLRALGGMKLPVPAGMDPNRARVDRRSMRGR